jgi:hypothetical protein
MESQKNTAVHDAKIATHGFRVKAKFDYLMLELLGVLTAIFVCLSWLHFYWDEKDYITSILAIPVLCIAMWWLHSQLMAVGRLFRFKSACVMDICGLSHFSMGYLAWTTIGGIDLIERQRDSDSVSYIEQFVVIGVTRDVFERICPSLMAGFAVRRYARFNESNWTIELSCDFLKIETHRFLWHLRDRADRHGGVRLKDWNPRESVEAAARRRDRLAQLNENRIVK